MLSTIVKYTNVDARKKVLEATSASYQHLMMSSVIKFATSSIMATRR